jgi:CBS domain-containing protein
MGALPRAILTFQLRLRSGFLGVPIYCGAHLVERSTTKRLSELVESVEIPHVRVDQSLALALERMGAAQLDILPVVSRADVHTLEGIVTLQDLFSSYGVGPRESV